MNNNSVVPENWQASTHLNPTIKSYADLAYRVKTHFGYPISVMELTDEMIANFIDEAIERYTQYAGYTEEYLIFCDDLYISGCGVKLDEIGQVRCNLQQCVLTSEEVYIAGQQIDEELLAVSSGLLSVTPFQYEQIYDKCDPKDIKVVMASGQTVEIRLDVDNPWNLEKSCQANSIRIYPKNSKCSDILLNPELTSLNINLEQYIEEHPEWLVELSGSPFELSSYPLIELGCSIISSIPVSSFDLSAFYDENILVGNETTACVNIKDGKGFIYPKCNTADIDTCEPLTQWFNNTTSLSSATHFISNNIPVCMGQSIPLDSFDGIIGKFTLCNTNINTFGAFPIKNVQFLIDVKPPEEILYIPLYNIQNGGFIMRYQITEKDDCVPATPDFVEVDIHFIKTTVTDITATRIVETSSFYDEGLLARRKIHGVFSTEPGNALGYSGYGANNILFNFDYTLMGNIFGFDMQGNRHNIARNGYDLVSMHLAFSFIEQVRKMLRYCSYTFDPDSQYLRVTPEPRQGRFGNTYVDNDVGKQCYMVGCYVEKPVEHIIKQKWVQDWVVACMMESIGLIRGQFGQVTLYGGATVTGESLITAGQSKKEKLLDELRKENYHSAPPLCFLG